MPQNDNNKFINRLIYSNGVAKVSSTLNEFESPRDFVNEITFFLLHLAKKWFNNEQYKYIILQVEFYNNKTLLVTTFNYGLYNDLTKFEQIFKELRACDSKDNNFIIKVIFNEEDQII